MIDTKNIKVGSKIEFDNGLLKGKATVTQIADKNALKKQTMNLYVTYWLMMKSLPFAVHPKSKRFINKSNVLT